MAQDVESRFIADVAAAQRGSKKAGTLTLPLRPLRRWERWLVNRMASFVARRLETGKVVDASNRADAERLLTLLRIALLNSGDRHE